MKVMYESKPDVLQQTDKYDYSALHFAARHGCLAAVNQVLEWDPKLIDGRTDAGYTPFMKAAAFGHVNVMMALYAKREDKQALLTGTDKMGSTALHSAALHDHSAAVSQLLEWGGGALLDIKSRLGGTPWDLAKHNRKIRDIMQKYADGRVRGRQGQRRAVRSSSDRCAGQGHTRLTRRRIPLEADAFHRGCTVWSRRHHEGHVGEQT